jgi:para-aminobenzoate synthetase / 4-amino-4-deoxychorismate lyase
MFRAPAKQNTPVMTTPQRPDPARGVFETMLVIGGEPVELEAHLNRIGASLAGLYEAALPATVADLVRERCAGLPLGRVRLTVAPNGADLNCDAVAAAIDSEIVFPTWERGAELRGLPLPDGLGPHKLVDRPGLSDCTGAVVPLLTEADGEVLEAGRANVFVARRGALVTPRADRRILPGLTRAAALAVARQEAIEVEERALSRNELLDADEVFLTGSVRGVEPARSLDGVPLAAGGELRELIAAGLGQRYGISRTAPATASRRA